MNRSYFIPTLLLFLLTGFIFIHDDETHGSHQTEYFLSVQRNHQSSEPCSVCHEKDIPIKKDPCTFCHSVDTELTHSGPVSVAGKPCLCCHEKHFQPAHPQKHCSHCHTPFSWRDKAVGYSTALQCSTCHEKEKRPHSHYRIPDCLLCHAGKKWDEIDFDHAGFSQCHTCHKRPTRHRTGKCIFCHDTVDWNSAS